MNGKNMTVSWAICIHISMDQNINIISIIQLCGNTIAIVFINLQITRIIFINIHLADVFTAPIDIDLSLLFQSFITFHFILNL